MHTADVHEPLLVHIQLSSKCVVCEGSYVLSEFYFEILRRQSILLFVFTIISVFSHVMRTMLAYGSPLTVQGQAA